MVGFRCVIALLIVFVINNDNVLSEHLGKETDKFLAKSFISSYGDMIDCVDMYNQPAFRNPLLKDHKLQRKPTNAPDIDAKESWSYIKEIMALKDSDRCSDGTVPIRRGAIQEHRTSEYHSNVFNPSAKGSAFRRAVVGIKLPPGNSFCGAIANVSIHNPPTFTEQMNAGMVRLGGGPTKDRHAIYVGWAVYPELYNDTLTHFSTFWKGYNKTGCYDLLCPGFVQIEAAFPVGRTLPEVSVYGGVQLQLSFKIHQDVETLNWWLTFVPQGITIGYWPRELFTHLDECASDLSFGGTVKNKPNIPYPPMGYGLFPNYNIFQSAYVGNIQYIGSDRLPVTPSKNQTFKSENSPECYRVVNIGPIWKGYTITYGGRGGQNC